MVDDRQFRVADDVVGIMAPCLLVVVHGSGRHVNPEAFCHLSARAAYATRVPPSEGGPAVSLQLRRGSAQTTHNCQSGVFLKGTFSDVGDSGRNLNFAQVAILEGIATDALDGGRQLDVAQVRVAHEPRSADVVESHALEAFELRELLNLIVFGKPSVKPVETLCFQLGGIVDRPPQAACHPVHSTCYPSVVLRRNLRGNSIVTQVAQGRLHRLVGDVEQTWQELVLVLCPCRVRLEPLHLSFSHFQSQVRTSSEDTLAQLNLFRFERFGVVRAQLP